MEYTKEGRKIGDRSQFLGFPIDLLTLSQAAELIASDAHPGSKTVITANAATLSMASHDENLKAALRSASLVVADGMSVVWGARLRGIPVPDRVAGIDLMTALLRRPENKRLSIYLLGATLEIVTKLKEDIASQYPGIRVVGFRDGYFKLTEQDSVIADIAATHPQVLFIGMPSPFKEAWAESNRDRLGAGWIIGVGGSFDVLAGVIRRAPKIVQRAGLEWAWRLAMEPRRLWRRYLHYNTQFLQLLLMDALQSTVRRLR